MEPNVLLVESSVPYRESLARSLVEKGVRVVEAGTGADAWQSLSANEFDIVVAHNILSDQSGVDLMQRIRNANPKLPLILVVEPLIDSKSKKDIEQKIENCSVVRGPMNGDIVLEHIRTALNPNPAKSKSRPSGPNSTDPPLEPYRDPQVENHLEVVRKSYKKKLPRELERLNEALREIKDNPDQKDAMRKAHRIAHSIHGTAGTLGFGEVSLAASDIEEGLNQLMAGNISFEEAWESIGTAMESAVTAPKRSSLVEKVGTKVIEIATILLVDEDRDTIASIGDAAKKNLISLVPASNEAEALDAMESRRIDGVIIDVDEKNQDRLFDLAGSLRSRAAGRNLPIAVMSIENTVVNRVAATHAGTSQFLHKPLNVEDLMETVREFCADRNEANSKILIVDDDIHFANHIANLLKQEEMDVSTLSDPIHILETLDRVVPEILLLDVYMPNINGFDLCRMLRSSTQWKNLPILFLTAETDAKVRLGCFQAGGDDYIEKPVIKEELLARIGVRQERIRLFKERADQDSLTHLPNRRSFLELFKTRVQEGQRYGRPVSLCLIDLDKFKNVNDAYGHLAGDQVLVSFGRLLSARFRTIDIRGRWGGEEFAVAFYGEDAKTGKMILSRVLDEFKAISFEGDKGQKFHTSFSSGIATFPDDGNSFNELFRVADEKLYRAKELGRCRIEI